MVSWCRAYVAAAKNELFDLKSRAQRKYRAPKPHRDLHEARDVKQREEVEEKAGSEVSFVQSEQGPALRQQVSDAVHAVQEVHEVPADADLQLADSPDLRMRANSRLSWLRPPSEWNRQPTQHAPLHAPLREWLGMPELDVAPEPERRPVTSISLKAMPSDWGGATAAVEVAESAPPSRPVEASRMGWVPRSTEEIMKSDTGETHERRLEMVDLPTKSAASAMKPHPETQMARPEEDIAIPQDTKRGSESQSREAPPPTPKSPQRRHPTPGSGLLQPPGQKSPRSPSIPSRTFNFSRTSSPPTSTASRLSPPTSPQMGELNPEEGPLLSLYERSKSSRTSAQNDWERSSQGSVASDASYNEELKSARANLKAALVADKKDLSNSYSRVALSIMDRVEQVIKELVRKGREDKQDARTRSPQAMHLQPSSSALLSPNGSFLHPPGKGSRELTKELSFNMSRNDTTMSSQLSGSLDKTGDANVAQDADEDEDYDSEDEGQMLARYAQRCNTEIAENLRSVLLQSGHQIPSMPSGPSNEETKAQVSEAVRQEILEYQQTIQDRLNRLGASSTMRKTDDPSEAVKDALLRYHTTCDKLGKLYAFEKPKEDLAPDWMDRRQIARYVRDLKDLNPDRYAQKK